MRPTCLLVTLLACKSSSGLMPATEARVVDGRVVDNDRGFTAIVDPDRFVGDDDDVVWIQVAVDNETDRPAVLHLADVRLIGADGQAWAAVGPGPDLDDAPLPLLGPTERLDAGGGLEGYVGFGYAVDDLQDVDLWVRPVDADTGEPVAELVLPLVLFGNPPGGGMPWSRAVGIRGSRAARSRSSARP